MQVEHGLSPGGHLRAVARVTGRILVLMGGAWVVLTLALPVVMVATEIVFQVMMAVVYLAIVVVILGALFRMRGR